MGMPASLARDLGMPDLPIDLGDMDPPSEISLEPVRSAAFYHLHRWLADGTPAPSFPRLEMGGDPPVVFRDEHGNGLGGIRLPDMAVPTATNKGDAIDGKRSLSGSNQPFSPETLRELYPDHDDLRRQGRSGRARQVSTRASSCRATPTSTDVPPRKRPFREPPGRVVVIAHPATVAS